MKKVGIALIIIGIIVTIFSGIALQREETVVEVGDVEITREDDKELTWPRWVGIAMIGGGVVVFLFGSRKGAK